MKLKITIIIFLTLSIVISSCGSKKPGNIGEYQKITEKGKIIEHVICKNDINQNYSLYLPSDYTPDKKYPIIYFFDPHAKGKKVISHYPLVNH